LLWGILGSGHGIKIGEHKWEMNSFPLTGNQ
jgi:hypothetical protein